LSADLANIRFQLLPIVHQANQGLDDDVVEAVVKMERRAITLQKTEKVYIKGIRKNCLLW